MVPKNVITRSLGPNPNVQIDLEGPHPIVLGDVYLLCSDGLAGRVEDAEIGAMLSEPAPARSGPGARRSRRTLRGGPDNVTVLIAKVTGPELVTADVSLEPLRMGSFQQPHPVQIAIWLVALIPPWPRASWR